MSFSNRDPFVILKLLAMLAPKHPTANDHKVRSFGYGGLVTALLFWGGIGLAEYLGRPEPAYNELMQIVGMLGFFVYMGCVIISATRLVGEEKKIVGFRSQSKHMLRALTLYMFLPAFILTVLGFIAILIYVHYFK